VVQPLQFETGDPLTPLLVLELNLICSILRITVAKESLKTYPTVGLWDRNWY